MHPQGSENGAFAGMRQIGKARRGSGGSNTFELNPPLPQRAGSHSAGEQIAQLALFFLQLLASLPFFSSDSLPCTFG
jgi:hypothetical protein